MVKDRFCYENINFGKVIVRMTEDRSYHGIVVKTVDASKFIHIYSFRMNHLLRLCSSDVHLASDVLDVFCVQGRQRIESLRMATNENDLDKALFDAVQCNMIIKLCIV